MDLPILEVSHKWNYTISLLSVSCKKVCVWRGWEGGRDIWDPLGPQQAQLSLQPSRPHHGTYMGRKGLPPRASCPGLWAPLCLLAARSIRDTAVLWLPATLCPCRSISPQSGHGKAAVDACTHGLPTPPTASSAHAALGLLAVAAPRGGTGLGARAPASCPALAASSPGSPGPGSGRLRKVSSPPLLPPYSSCLRPGRGDGTDPSRQGASQLWVRPTSLASVQI